MSAEYNSSFLTQISAQTPIVFFDGVCHFCNGTVNILIDNDSRQRLRYAPLQGETYTLLRQHIPTLPSSIDTVILYHAGKVFMKSTAVLEIARLLGGKWKLALALRIIPRFLRDAVYDVIANYRYQWFGRYESCRLPTHEERALFLP
jgi:predicted DCC family thiol-disulfide oxidoreductase YuxK